MPSDLYVYRAEVQKDLPEPVSLKVNGATETLRITNGFASVRRAWKNGDTIELHLPMRPHRVLANEQVAADNGRMAIQYGPLVYCVEGLDNGGKVVDRDFASSGPLTAEYRADLLGGISVVKGKWADGTDLMAVPYYAWGNRGNNEMCVWIRAKVSTE